LIEAKESIMSETIEQEILTYEEHLIQAKRTLDLDALQWIYADDLLMSGVLGEPTCSKSAIIDEAKRGVEQRQNAIAGDRKLEVSVENEDMKVAAHGNTAIANYRFVVKIKSENIDVVRQYRTTNVWMKRQGRWQIVAAHMAFVLDPKQAAMLSGEAR
jgi:ketosteroid isomerase-like protein